MEVFFTSPSGNPACRRMLIVVGLTGAWSFGSRTGGEMRSRSGTGSSVIMPSHHRRRANRRSAPPAPGCNAARPPWDAQETGRPTGAPAPDIRSAPAPFAGPDIGDRVGEDIRSLLFGERGLLSVLLRLLVDDARLLPLLDVADHDAVADHHLERIHRAAIRQRIDINRLDPILGRVAEYLGDAGAKRGPDTVTSTSMPRRSASV